MPVNKLLIANRGEIAIRINRAAVDLGLRAVAVYPEDDNESLHVRVADEAIILPGRGVAAYLDVEAIIEATKKSGCDAIHPGYGFLAESAAFARRCSEEGITFVGPRVEHLELFGDKAEARRVAAEAGVPIPRGLNRPVSLAESRAFFDFLGENGAMMIKAVFGGGGRGTREVIDPTEVEAAFERCQSEAKSSFGNGDVYVEEFIPQARHIEIQILGDREGHVTHLGERECSIQRRYQKLIEIAPAPGLDKDLRQEIIDAALRLAQQVGYSNVGTFEFLVDVSGRENAEPFVFIEANARLQVEHTVTEEVTAVDIVQAQIRLADGATLVDLGLDEPSMAVPRGYAVEARVNMESIDQDGTVRPGGGMLVLYEAPSGPGVRTDGFGYAGYHTSGSFDSLLAKVIAHTYSPKFANTVTRISRGLSEFRIAGVETNIGFLMNILNHEDFIAGRTHTRWVDDHIAELATIEATYFHRFVDQVQPDSGQPEVGFAGARVDTRDPLALFEYDSKVKAEQAALGSASSLGLTGDGSVGGVASAIQGTLVSIDVGVGDEVVKGQQVAVIEAMKMEHILRADRSGVVRRITMAPGETVREGYPIVLIEEGEVEGDDLDLNHVEIDPGYIRPDLQENLDRHAYTLDENRQEAVGKRRARGYRMPRENIAELVDPGSFKEYWPLIVARQHLRYDMETLRRKTPADGLIAGTGTINGDLFGEEDARAMVVHYDYTVLAGTQGGANHYKQDRMYELANRFRLPLVLFAEGGGGRPGDDQLSPRVAADTYTFTQFSKLSGLIPLVGVTNGRCFAGNTALLACCDVIIATEGSTIGMGGPAMIEGGGLGVYTPEEVGPMSVQVPNGVVDILVADEAAAVETAKKYLSYFQGSIKHWVANDQRPLRHMVPENRLRLYNMREIIQILADKDSILEIREKFGVGIITAFIRIEGHPMGVIANNPHHLAGAIDSDGADKAARFLQLCDAFDLPVLSLMDCPGMMVGPDVERTALVRHCVRTFNAGANLTTPLFGVIVRKAYGLGVQAMCGASTRVGFFTVAWPTAEFAGMNIEGAVKLGYRNEIAAIEDPEERRAEFQRRVEFAYEEAKAVNAASGGGVDDVIDPADTRDWIAKSLRRLPPIPTRNGKKYPYIDTW